MYLYIPITHKMKSPELEQYRATGLYAVCITRGKCCCQTFITDVSPNFREVFRLALHCTKGQLHPCHLKEVVEDYLSI